MTRFYRSILALFVGLILGGFATYASAESIPSSQFRTAKCQTPAYVWGPTIQFDMSAGIAQMYPVACAAANCPSTSLCANNIITGCPTGQGWTLAGSVCTRPDCPEGQVRDEAGACIAPPCPVGAASTASRYTGVFATGSGESVYGVYSPPPATLCNGACVGTIGSATGCDAGTAVQGAAVQCQYAITLTGQTCSGSNGAAPVDPLPTAPSPPCAPGDGVISNASGKVVCVPNGQNFQQATYPPKINTSSTTQTNSDGSTKTTTTTQVCTGAGACSTTINTSVTAASGGAPGAAGTPGTSTSQTDKPGEDQADFCARNPSLQICKGDMNKEATQLQIRDEIKKLTEPTVIDDGPLSSATHSAESQTALETENNKFTQAATGVVDATSANKSAWESALASGFISPIPIASCAPYSVNIGGRPWTWDYCPTATKISEIGAYALWVMAAFGVFVMLTGGRNAST
jgi:hypothetical protein